MHDAARAGSGFSPEPTPASEESERSRGVVFVPGDFLGSFLLGRFFFLFLVLDFFRSRGVVFVPGDFLGIFLLGRFLFLFLVRDFLLFLVHDFLLLLFRIHDFLLVFRIHGFLPFILGSFLLPPLVGAFGHLRGVSVGMFPAEQRSHVLELAEGQALVRGRRTQSRLVRVQNATQRRLFFEGDAQGAHRDVPGTP